MSPSPTRWRGHAEDAAAARIWDLSSAPRAVGCLKRARAGECVQRVSPSARGSYNPWRSRVARVLRKGGKILREQGLNTQAKQQKPEAPQASCGMVAWNGSVSRAVRVRQILRRHTVLRSGADLRRGIVSNQKVAASSARREGCGWTYLSQNARARR